MSGAGQLVLSLKDAILLQVASIIWALCIPILCAVGIPIIIVLSIIKPKRSLSVQDPDTLSIMAYILFLPIVGTYVTWNTICKCAVRFAYAMMGLQPPP